MFDIEEQIKSIYIRKQSEHQRKLDFVEDKLGDNEEYVKLSNTIETIRFDALGYELNGFLDKATKLRETMKPLIEKKEKMIEEAKKIYSSFIIDKYDCEKCKDTGFYQGYKCDCYFNEYINYTNSLLGTKTKFEYKNNVESLEKYFDISSKYVEKFPNANFKNLLFTGKTGTGKTNLAKMIGLKVLHKGFDPIFISSVKLNDILFSIHTDKKDKTYQDLLNNCDLLIIDDLGTEPILKNVTIEYLLYIITYRLEQELPIIITTNLTLDELKDRYNERLFSRLLDKNYTAVLEFKGKDLRVNI